MDMGVIGQGTFLRRRLRDREDSGRLPQEPQEPQVLGHLTA